jgi:diguanylate cyclase (GGDEF)-like protein
MWSRIADYFAAGEIDTPAGRALVEERYSNLRRQIPIVYVLASVNLFSLQVVSGGHLQLGFNPPTAMALCAAIRTLQWMRPESTITHRLMLRRMNQTIWLALIICAVVFGWCFQIRDHSPGSQMGVLLFGALTAIGVSYGLSSLPAAARLPLLVLALPLAAVTVVASDPQFIGAALSLSFVALLLLRVLDVNNAHFTAVIESRSIVAIQQQLAESARKEAIIAATTDFLTGLPNRRAFVAALEAQFEAAAPDGRGFAVGILDLDRFKAINDTFGHATGDKLLTTVARRLRSAAGKTVVVARLGGDEFGLLLTDVRTTAEADAAARAILAAANRPVRVGGRKFIISLCGGVALASGRKERTPSRVLADADLALYEAKERADGGVAIFEPRMEAPRRRRMQIERALQTPGVQEHIDLVYQPIFDLRTGKVIANEALARWTDAELGAVSPAEFVPIAEQLNVIGSLSNHLLAKALAEAAAWPESIRLSFNLSAVALCDADSASTILDALRRAKLPTCRFQVEVTETALLRDFDRAKANLAALSAAGVTVVLDDFGAGYASIGYLRQLRFDQIKLDGGLLTAALDNPDGERLLCAVIGLCQSLGVDTVAEHVERDRQLELLVRMGCSAAQGFWLRDPMTAEDCRTFCNSADMVTGTWREHRSVA